MPMCITGANNRLQTRVGVGYSAPQARKALFVVLPIIVLLVGYVSWLLFR